MRTLIISDLHLGTRVGHDVLRRPAARRRLLSALDEVERLVLLGDTIELMTRHPARAMAIAEPVLRAVGRRLGPDREVIVIPGNHDRRLLGSWPRSQGDRLAPDSRADPAATPELRSLLEWLAPARTRVHYPGVWLGDGIWATHGHYLDRHLFPESAFGMPRGRLRREPVAVVGAAGYELARRRGREPRGEFLDRLAQRPLATVLEGAGELLRSATYPLPRVLMHARLAPLTATLIDAQMRHASVPAIARVARRLGVEADWIVFGHVHRRGPLDGEHWPPEPGLTGVLNTGSWLFEPLLVDRAVPPHPYWPGGGVLLAPGRDPRSIGLLDDLGAEELSAGLRPQRARR